ncbi:GNAT family N-acetyltransferase [Chondromyces apiculatus]|uniref:N-acetyltransferase domain-containing protein n=1 Tax=Chondromyces apiculatus DSM 436 TaxID=1192034 RepID=A0A017T6D6_9BACT|nr:GNAT family protein [Chondromyces apiculatus]EYF04131.1 Hypothetical protein CAP_4814 [Chondromyces apiculatus DSM 436]
MRLVTARFTVLSESDSAARAWRRRFSAITTPKGDPIFTLGHITLRPLEFSDADRLYAWEGDEELGRFSGWSRPVSRSAFAKRLERLIEEPPSDAVLFGIALNEKLVGRIELALIDRRNSLAFVGIFVGDRAARGQGVGVAALRLAAEYAFTVENLEKLCAHVYGFNVRAQRLMVRAGFQPEGVLRSHEVHHGARQDVHVYGLLKAELSVDRDAGHAEGAPDGLEAGT